MNLKEAAKKAQQRKEITPALKFGSENEEGSVIVRVTEPTFGTATNPNPLPGRDPEFMTLKVTVLENSDFGHRAGEELQINAGVGSTLGDGLLKAWAEHKENLNGVVLRIETRNVFIKKVGKKSRVYNVREIKDYATAQ